MTRSASMKAAAMLLTAAAGAPAVDRRLGFSFGTITADAGNPASFGGAGSSSSFPMGFGGLMMPVPSDPNAPMLTPEQDAEVAKYSSDFVENAIKAFLGKQNLPPSEVQCIQDNSGQIGANVGRMVEQMGLVVQKAFDVDLPFVPDAVMAVESGDASSPKSFDLSSFGSADDGGSVGSIADKIFQQESGGAVARTSAPAVPAAPAPGPRPAPSKAVDPTLSFFYNQGRRLQLLPGFPQASSSSSSSSGFSTMESLPMAMELGMYMKQITDETKQLVQACIHSDARLAFEEAGKHAASLQHIMGHFMANGADVVNEFADMVLAYDEKDSQRLGTDFGTAMRKIFLSNNTNSRLPEGLPSELQIANASAGLLRGFFGEGTALKVSLQKDPLHPLNIDMQNCVRQNTPYFQQIWSQVMYLFGQQSAGVGQAAAAGGLASEQGKVQFGTSLAFSMMELPQAMSKCGINEDQREMIMDSVKALGSGLRAKVSLPQREVPKMELQDDFAKTVETWAGKNYYDFGQDLGALLQESAVKFYPRKYSVDAGMLRRQLLPEVSSRASTLLPFLPAALALVSGLVAVQLRRRRGSRQGNVLITDADMELGQDDALE